MKKGIIYLTSLMILFSGERLGWKEKTDTRSIAEYHRSP